MKKYTIRQLVDVIKSHYEYEQYLEEEILTYTDMIKIQNEVHKQINKALLYSSKARDLPDKSG